MYPSMLKGPGELFADFSRLQERLDELLGEGRESSSIRAVARTGAFPVLNVGTGEEAMEIYALAPGLDPQAIEVTVEKGLLSFPGSGIRALTKDPRRSCTPASASPARSAGSSVSRRTPTRPRSRRATATAC